MKCRDCGKQMTEAVEGYRYVESGLPNIILHGVKVRRCRDCGAQDVSIPRIAELHRAIASTIIRNDAPLAPEEIKYLRKYLGWSGADFAEHMGKNVATVSRWENGRLAMSSTADRLLRTLVAIKSPVESYSVDVLKTISPKGQTKPLRVGLRLDSSGWHEDAAA
jgi:putative zinc finger/helix-turn-helix YgiT family protein